MHRCQHFHTTKLKYENGQNAVTNDVKRDSSA